MGSKTWILIGHNDNVADVLASKPPLDVARTRVHVESLFPEGVIKETGRGSLTFAAADGSRVLAATYGDVFLLSCEQIAIDYPSKLLREFRSEEFGSNHSLVCLYSVVDWFAMARWQGGQLLRALSLSPDQGVSEDIGERLPFEEPYWNGAHPALDPEEDDDEYPFPFHPLELGEDALLNFFGYQIEGYPEKWSFDPDEIELLEYSVARKPWWQFW